MKLKRSLIILLLVCGVIVMSSLLFAENLTLSTYYPAPFGAYDRVRLVPRESLPAEEYCMSEENLGVMYYDNGANDLKEGLYVCHKMSEDDFEWVLISRPLKLEPGAIRNAKVVCLKDNEKLGVCMNNPSYDGTCACQ